jgi:hypothetical protein
MTSTIQRSAACVVGAVVAATTLTIPAGAQSATSRIVVGPGESIQAALDTAAPGSTIVVRPGTYFEQLRITTDDITVRARNVVLSPPAETVDGTCQEEGATGICVIGDVDESGAVIEPVRNVTISGITTRDFTGTGIYAYGVDGFTANRSTFVDNGGYGVFARRSSDITFTNNLAAGNVSAGFYVGINPDAGLHMSGNHAFRNREGLLMLDTVGGVIANNVFDDNCVGALLVGSGAPGQEPTSDVVLVGNTMRDNTLTCGPLGETIPPLSGSGILIAGASDVLVLDNVVSGNVPAGPTGARSGISIVPGLAGDLGTGNRIIANSVRDNVPLDIELAQGGEVDVVANRCGTSDVEGVCDATVVAPAPEPAPEPQPTEPQPTEPQPTEPYDTPSVP